MSGSGKVRVGVIGAGSWAVSNHMPVLAARDDVELVSVVRKGPEALRYVQERFGFAHASEDYRDALEQGLDAVVVAGPSGFHHEHAKAALEAGANVLCEKPVTIEPADAWDLHETAERLGRHLVISFGWNYGPLGIEAKRIMVSEGGVGALEHVMVQMASGTREAVERHRWVRGFRRRHDARLGHLDRSGPLRRRLRPGPTQPPPWGWPCG